MKRISIGNSSQPEAPATSRRDILKSAMALGGVTAAGTFGPGAIDEAAARKYHQKKYHHKHHRTLALPRAVDLRNVGGKNYISSVKDQDANGPCNSCTAFAVIAAIEGSYSFQKNLPITNPGNEPAFSERQLFFCNVPTGCNVTAWYPEDALSACLRTGVTDRANNVFDPMHPNVTCKVPGASWNWTRLTSTVRLNNDNDMKKWISGTHPSGPGGPVIAVMIEYDDLRQFSGGESTTYSPAATSNPRIGGHVVCIVGYDDTSANDKFWICKNSWGTTVWNPNGHGYFRAKQEKTGQRVTFIDSFDMWGVVVA